MDDFRRHIIYIQFKTSTYGVYVLLHLNIEICGEQNSFH